jgi:hypothetical protein
MGSCDSRAMCGQIVPRIRGELVLSAEPSLLAVQQPRGRGCDNRYRSCSAE